MPLYEYECEDCGHRFERIQKFSDALVSTCPACGGKVRKLLSSPAIQFKGTGWYITDYARKPSEGQAAESGSEASSGKDSSKKASESKDAKSSGSASSSGSESQTASKSKTGSASSSSTTK